MLDFFKKAAKVYLNVFFWLFMIGDVFAGIGLGAIVNLFSMLNINNSFSNQSEDYTAGILAGIFGTLILWLITVLGFSLIGSFIALVDDVSAIRRKIEGGEVSQEQSRYIRSEEKNYGELIKKLSSDNRPSRFWDCSKCGNSNSASNTFCEQCGSRKPDNPRPNADNSNGARFWVCGFCGSYNPFSAKSCENCGTPKP